MSTYMGTLVAPQRGEGADGCPRKSLSTVPRQRGEVRRWRTSVGYADHAAPPRVAGSYALLRPWAGPERYAPVWPVWSGQSGISRS